MQPIEIASRLGLCTQRCWKGVRAKFAPNRLFFHPESPKREAIDCPCTQVYPNWAKPSHPSEVKSRYLKNRKSGGYSSTRAHTCCFYSPPAASLLTSFAAATANQRACRKGIEPPSVHRRRKAVLALAQSQQRTEHLLFHLPTTLPSLRHQHHPGRAVHGL